jgi:phosphopantetheinyl transferase (holo-ACP synthase)
MHWCHVLEFTKMKLQKKLQKTTQSFAKASISHDKHTLFALEESEPPHMTNTYESQ